MDRVLGQELVEDRGAGSREPDDEEGLLHFLALDLGVPPKGVDDLQPISQEHQHVASREHAAQERELRLVLEGVGEPFQGLAKVVRSEVVESGLSTRRFEQPRVTETDQRLEGRRESVQGPRPACALPGEVGELANVGPGLGQRLGPDGSVEIGCAQASPPSC